jgi:putative PIN family toxin of toxin-antitoxin system
VQRVVLDTSVVAAAFRSRNGASWVLLERIADRRLIALATPALFLEYEAVLKRTEQRVVSGLTLEEVDDRLSALASAIEPVTAHFIWRPQLADADDEMVLDAAVNGCADALVTFNVRDFVVAAKRFNLAVMRPGEALEALRL